MTRVGAWVRAQRLFGFGLGALRYSRAADRTLCQVGFMDFDPLHDAEGDTPSMFVLVGHGRTWSDAFAMARLQAKEWKENGWWPNHLRQ